MFICWLPQPQHTAAAAACLQVQNAFFSGAVQVIVATIAFGEFFRLSLRLQEVCRELLFAV